VPAGVGYAGTIPRLINCRRWGLNGFECAQVRAGLVERIDTASARDHCADPVRAIVVGQLTFGLARHGDTERFDKIELSN
jgi:hypothetical protein